MPPRGEKLHWAARIPRLPGVRQTVPATASVFFAGTVRRVPGLRESRPSMLEAATDQTGVSCGVLVGCPQPAGENISRTPARSTSRRCSARLVRRHWRWLYLESRAAGDAGFNEKSDDCESYPAAIARTTPGRHSLMWLHARSASVNPQGVRRAPRELPVASAKVLLDRAAARRSERPKNRRAQWEKRCNRCSAAVWSPLGSRASVKQRPNGRFRNRRRH